MTRVVALWGVAALAAKGLNLALAEVMPGSWRLVASLFAGVAVAVLLLRDDIAPILRRKFFSWRHPIVLALAIYVGYQWHAYDYSRSEEAQLNEARRFACAQSQLCQKMAVEYMAGK